MTISIRDLIDGSIAVDRDNQDKRAKLQANIRRLENKISRLPNLGSAGLAEVLAEQLKPHFDGCDVDVLGPFGLGSEVAIHINRAGTRETIASISMRPTSDMNGITGLKRLSARETGQYPPRSMGAINGLNKEEIDLPDTIEDLVAELRAQADEKAARQSTEA